MIPAFMALAAQEFHRLFRLSSVNREGVDTEASGFKIIAKKSYAQLDGGDAKMCISSLLGEAITR